MELYGPLDTALKGKNIIWDSHFFFRSHDEEIAKKCPIEQCQKMFKIQLGKSMRNHLRNLHKINPGRSLYILSTKYGH